MTKKKVTTQVLTRTIQLRPVDRTVKTLQTWKQALLSAESTIHPVRKLLYDQYADIYLDEHLRSVLDKRRRALSQATIVFHIDGKPVEDMQKLIGKRFFKKLLTHILDARFYGYSLIQVDFNQGITNLVPRAHVVPTRGLVVATPYDTAGIDYTDPQYSSLYLAVGEDDDLGLLLPAAYLVLIKRGDVTDWASFNEIFGQPLRKGQYDPLDPAGKAELEKQLEEMGSSSWVVVPEGTDVTFAEANRTGAKDTYEALADRMDKGLSKLIIGQTMTIDAEGGQYKGEVHERVADEVAKDDLEYVLSYLNEHVLEMLIAQGFPVVGEFKYIEEEVKISKKDRLEMDLKIHKEVAPIDIDYFAEEYNVPIDQAALKARQDAAEAIKNQPASVDEKPAKKGKGTPTKKQQNSASDEAGLRERVLAWLTEKLGAEFMASFR